MGYYARVVMDVDFLEHINMNHDPETGLFLPGDGDHDGYLNDNYNKDHRQKYYGTDDDNIWGYADYTVDSVWQESYADSAEQFVKENGNGPVSGKGSQSQTRPKRDNRSPKTTNDKAIEKEEKEESEESKNKNDSFNPAAFSNATRSTAASTSSLLETIYGKKAYYRKYNIDTSQLSDEEMRRAINRANLERTYNDTFNPVVKNQSLDKAQKYISGIGQVAAASASVLGLIAAIKGMSKKKK